jgi:pilus assembly protein CpaB
MKKRSSMLAVAGLLASLIGMLLVFVYTARVKAGAGDQLAATATAFVATEDVGLGTSWEDMSGLVKKQKVPPELRPASAVSNPGQVKGKASVRPISKGEILTTTQFDTAKSGSLATPKGYDAVTINLAPPQGVALYIQPGVKANIYVSFKGAPAGVDPTEAVVTKLLLSNVNVLANRPASPASADGAAQEPSAGQEILLTLAVTPDEAEKLIFAKENGSIWLGLPNPENPPATTAGRTFKTTLL